MKPLRRGSKAMITSPAGSTTGSLSAKSTVLIKQTFIKPNTENMGLSSSELILILHFLVKK